MKNEKGFSLVEVLIALSILIAGAVAMMKFQSGQVKTNKDIENRAEITSLLNEMRGMLSTPKYCTDSFVGLNPSSSIPTKFVLNGADKFVAGSGQNYGQGSVKINSYRFDTSGLATNEMFLVVKFDMGKGGTIESIERRIKLNLEPNNSSPITKCFSIDSGESNPWQFNNTGDLIFNSSGNVQIGDTVNNSNLNVFGNASANQFCIGGNCRTTFAMQDCGTYKTVKTINANGTVICEPQGGGQACPTGQSVRGFDANGNILCTNSAGVRNCALQVCNTGDWGDCHCPAGKRVLTGGCHANSNGNPLSNYYNRSWPASLTHWSCGGSGGNKTIQVICCEGLDG